MKVTLKAAAAILENARNRMSKEHAGYYAMQIQNVSVNDRTREAAKFIGKAVESLGYGFRQSADGSRFCWITSGSNVVMCDTAKNTVTFFGVRHGVAPLWWFGDFKKLPVIAHESTMPWIGPWMTLEDFFEKSDKTSANPYERALALLKEGKTREFLRAEGLPVKEALGMYAQCKSRGYCL